MLLETKGLLRTSTVFRFATMHFLTLHRMFPCGFPQESVKGRIVIFRPDKNAERMKNGAGRLSMPAVSEQQFVDAVKAVVSANKDFVSSDTHAGQLILPCNLPTSQ